MIVQRDVQRDDPPSGFRPRCGFQTNRKRTANLTEEFAGHDRRFGNQAGRGVDHDAVALFAWAEVAHMQVHRFGLSRPQHDTVRFRPNPKRIEPIAIVGIGLRA